MQNILDPLRMCKYILLFVNINKKTSWSLLWIGFNCLKAIESLQWYRFFCLQDLSPQDFLTLK